MVLRTDTVLGIALGIMRSHPYGFLATTSSPSGPNLRLVQHLLVDDEATIWISTSPRSRKAHEIAARPTATYGVEDRAAFAYVTARGPAELVDDPTVGARLWDEDLRAFFPAGPNGGDFVLIRLRPETLEVMDFARQVHPEPYGLAPEVMTRQGTGWAFRPADARPPSRVARPVGPSPGGRPAPGDPGAGG